MTYRIAIIGVGGIATMHAKAIGDLPNAEVVAGSCRTESKGRKFAEDFNCKWFADYEAMLDDVKPDVVCIATPSGAHLEPTQAAAKRGIHVICEKPLEISTQRVDQMIAVCKDAGVVLGGIFPSRFNEVNLHLKEAIAAGRFGQIAIGAAYVPWWRDDAYYAPERWQGTLALDGGGALMNQSIHNIDALQWLMGFDPALSSLSPADNPVAEVFAYTGKLGHAEDLIEVEDTAVALLKFKNGALGQLLGATSMYPGKDRRLTIAGRDGSAEIVEEQLTIFHFRESRDADQTLLDQYAAASTSTGASDPLAISYGGHTKNIAAILAAIDAGESPAIDGLQSRKAVAIIQAIYASAASGKPVQVD